MKQIIESEAPKLNDEGIGIRYYVSMHHTEIDEFWGGEKRIYMLLYDGNSWLKALWCFLKNFRKFNRISCERREVDSEIISRRF